MSISDPSNLSPVNITFICHTDKLSISNNSLALSIVINKSLQGKNFRQNKISYSLYRTYLNDSCFDKMDLSSGISSKKQNSTSLCRKESNRCPRCLLNLSLKA